MLPCSDLLSLTERHRPRRPRRGQSRPRQSTDQQGEHRHPRRACSETPGRGDSRPMCR